MGTPVHNSKTLLQGAYHFDILAKSPRKFIFFWVVATKGSIWLVNTARQIDSVAVIRNSAFSLLDTLTIFPFLKLKLNTLPVSANLTASSIVISVLSPRTL